MRKVLALAVIVSCIICSSTAHCWENAFNENPNIKTVDGKVSDVDVQGSRITIKSVDVMTFSVPLNTRLVQDMYDIKLSDIKSGDYVTIDYLDNAAGKHEAQVITVHYEEGEGI